LRKQRLAVPSVRETKEKLDPRPRQRKRESDSTYKNTWFRKKQKKLAMSRYQKITSLGRTTNPSSSKVKKQILAKSLKKGIRRTEEEKKKRNFSGFAT